MASFIHKERVELCYNIQLGEVFDFTTNAILGTEAILSSVPVEFMIPPFITAVSHFLNKSEINPWKNWYQPSIIYSTTVGFTGTNKTAAMDCVRNAIADVEMANGLSEMSSRINQCNISIKKPIVNICGMSHPGEICKVLDEERKNSNTNDGLYSSFLMSMPRPQFLDADVDMEDETASADIARLFYVIDANHREKCTYLYNDEAKEEAIRFYNEQQDFLRMNHSSDTYTSGVIGKLKGHVHRLAMVIQALDDAGQIPTQSEELKRGPLDTDFKQKIKSVLQEDTTTVREITKENTVRSITLTTYFFQHKKFLSGYNTAGVAPVPILSNPLAKKILLHPGSVVPCNSITRNSKYTAEQVKQEIKTLSEHGLGETKLEKPSGGGRMMVIFYKKSVQDNGLEETATLTSKLAKYSVNIDDYINNIINSENVPPHKKVKLTVENSV